MEMRRIGNSRDAHAQLVLQLCEALSVFVAATVVEHEAEQVRSFEWPVNDNISSTRTNIHFGDVLSLRDILVEFGLKQSQVLKLRKSWDFPAPIGRARPIMFRRSEVEQWVRSQPNRKNLAIVLRSRKRRFC